MNSQWTFLSNHGRVFEYVATHEKPIADYMARDIGVTQRIIYKMLKDLETEGYITRKKVGRCNQYEVHADLPMRHYLDNNRPVGEILPGWTKNSSYYVTMR